MGDSKVKNIVKAVLIVIAVAVVAIAVILVLRHLGSKADTQVNAGDVSMEELEGLVNRVCDVASIRYTGKTQDTEQLILSTIGGDKATEMVQEYSDAYKNEFISLQEEIDNAYQEQYDALYIIGRGVDVNLGNPPEQSEPTEANTPEPTEPEPVEQPEPIDTATDEPEVTEPEVTPVSTPTPVSNSTTDQGIPDYDEWLQSEEAQNLGYTDVRIVYEDGVPGIWTADFQADADGYTKVVILDELVPVYIGTAISKLSLVGDHAYDFEVKSYGLYDNNVCVITMKSKDVELPMEGTNNGETTDTSDDDGSDSLDSGDGTIRMSASYTLTVKGTVGRNKDTGELMFTPTDESYVHLVSDLSTHYT